MANSLKRVIFSLTLIFVCIAVVLAGKGEIEFVECDVDIKANGNAVIGYTVRYKVISGELHGFYFNGNDRLVINSFSDKSYAVDDNGTSYKLSITDMYNGTYDIVLADGNGVSTGTVTYFFWFETNMAAAGYLGGTTAADSSSLVFFDWSPVIWDYDADNMNHYTLKILFPFSAPEMPNIREWVYNDSIVLTEKYLNENYLIDYVKGPAERLQMIIHKNNPPASFHMITKFYMPAEWFSTDTISMYSSEFINNNQQ